MSYMYGIEKPRAVSILTKTRNRIYILLSYTAFDQTRKNVGIYVV